MQRPAIRRRPYRADMSRTRLYRDGELVLENFPVADISEHIKEPNACVWLDYCEPTPAELASIANELGLHPLAVEDAINEHQRPKLDRYDSHLFISAYALALDTASGELRTSEIGVFVTPSALVTVRKDEGVDIDAVVARWDESKELAVHGVSFLLWGLLDFIVDGHFETVQSLDTEIEQLEDLLFDEAPLEREVQRRSFELRKSLVLLRRLVLPMREVVNSLMRRDLHVIDQGMCALLPGCLRPRDARDRLDGVAARSRHDDPRDEHRDPGQSHEPRHEEGHQLGGDHRRADRDHGFLRTEHPVPRLRDALGLLVLLGDDRRHLRQPVLPISPLGLAVSARRDARRAAHTR